MPVLDNYVNVHEAAEVLGVHWETVKRMCREGRMPARKVHNMWLIDKTDLSRFAVDYDEPRRGKRKTNFTSMTIGRTGSGPFLVLENNLGTFDDLVTVKTKGEYRKDVIAKIKRNLESWMANPYFEDVKTSNLDLAIIARVSPSRIKNQDVDNLAKIVMDALKKSEGDSRFLFYDDRQVVRLLVWKLQETEYAGYNTDTLTISFRIHDESKQMTLVEPRVM